MILAFIDEASDSKFSHYFGLCCAVINANYYHPIKLGFQKALLNGGWDPAIEFKGSFLFSATQGCQSVPIEKRIDIAKAILSLNIAKKNARMRFAYVNKVSENQKNDYLKHLPQLLAKALPRPLKGQGKNLLALHCDYRSDIAIPEIRQAVEGIVNTKGYTLLEDIVTPKSCFHTIGILYADIVGYLSARIDTITSDIKLFENIPPDQFENNGKVKKLRSSDTLIKLLKQFDRYEVVPKKMRGAGAAD